MSIPLPLWYVIFTLVLCIMLQLGTIYHCRGLDKDHFRRLLQCWALMHMEPLHKMARDLQPAFDRPVPDVIRSQQVTTGRPIFSFASCQQSVWHVPEPPAQTPHLSYTTLVAPKGWAE